MNVQRKLSPVPFHSIEDGGCGLARIEPKPTASSTVTSLTHSITLENFNLSCSLRSFDAAEKFSHKSPVDVKLELDAKKKALLIVSFKLMVKELADFKLSQRHSKESGLSTLETFNQKIYAILVAEEKCSPKLKKISALYSCPEVVEMLQCIEAWTINLKKGSPEDPFIRSLQLHLFTHSAFLKKLHVYETTEKMKKAVNSYQNAINKLSTNFLHSCRIHQKTRLSETTEKLSTYLQLNSSQTIAYEEARTTLIAHYGRRVVDEIEIGLPVNLTLEPISAAHFREMLVSIALRVKKEDLLALYQAIKGNDSEELFACMQNIHPEIVAQLKATKDFDALNYEQLDYLVSAFRSYTFFGADGSKTNATTQNPHPFSIKPINKELIKGISKNQLSPITRLALKFLAASERAGTYIQFDEDSIEAKYAPREYLAREVAPALEFSGNKGTIFKSVTTQNTLSFSYLADAFYEGGMQAYLVHPITSDPKGTHISLLFGGDKKNTATTERGLSARSLQAGSMSLATLKNNLWKKFVKKIPKSPHIEVDVVGYDVGAHNAMLFSEQFATFYYCEAMSNTWHDLENDETIQLEDLANLANIKLLQVWAIVPRSSSLIDCTKYNFRRFLLQQAPIENQPLIAHHYLLTANDIQPYLQLYGWVDPSLPDSRYAQDPAKIWPYIDKDGKEHQIQDVDLVVAIPLTQYSSPIRMFLPNWKCTQKNSDDVSESYFKEIPPEQVNNHLGSNPLIVAIANTAFSLIKRNVWDNLSLPKLLSNIPTPRWSPYSFISTSAIQG